MQVWTILNLMHVDSFKNNYKPVITDCDKIQLVSFTIFQHRDSPKYVGDRIYFFISLIQEYFN